MLQKKLWGRVSRTGHWMRLWLGTEVMQRLNQRMALDFSLGNTVDGGTINWEKIQEGSDLGWNKVSLCLEMLTFEVPARHSKKPTYPNKNWLKNESCVDPGPDQYQQPRKSSHFTCNYLYLGFKKDKRKSEDNQWKCLSPSPAWEAPWRPAGLTSSLAGWPMTLFSHLSFTKHVHIPDLI